MLVGSGPEDHADHDRRDRRDRRDRPRGVAGGRWVRGHAAGGGPDGAAGDNARLRDLLFAEKNWLRFFNLFHATTREANIRSELTIAEGELLVALGSDTYTIGVSDHRIQQS